MQLVLVSPESLIEVPKYRNMLLSKTYQEKLVALVVDEAHCVKKWGDQFRTAVAQIGELRSIIPKKVKILALTLSALMMVFLFMPIDFNMVFNLRIRCSWFKSGVPGSNHMGCYTQSSPSCLQFVTMSTGVPFSQRRRIVKSKNLWPPWHSSTCLMT